MAKDSQKFEADADAVAKTMKNWVGNPISRAMLRFVCKRDEEGNRMDLGLKRYAGMDVPLTIKQKIAARVVSFAMNNSVKSFGVPAEQVKAALKDPIFRRAIVNIMEGIAVFGIQRPQTVAAPFVVVWDFTRRCNLRCKHCYQDSDARVMPDELNTEESRKVIDQLADAGVVALAFSGGEPLLRKDFFELAKYARDRDLYVSIATNGTLITKDVAKRLKAVGLNYAEISLDGFERTHDRFRGIPGVWKRTCEGIKNCVEVGIDTCVAMTVTKWNLKEIPRFIEFVENELRACRIMFFNFIPTKRGKDIAKQDITPQEREELMDFLYKQLLDKKVGLSIFSTSPQFAVASARYVDGPAITSHFTPDTAMDQLKGRTKSLTEFIGGCGCARLYAALEPNGDIYPCVFLPLKIGNIRKDNIKDVWLNSPELKKMRDREAFVGCGTCKYSKICGGCRARAYGYFNDLQGPDPGCTYNIKYWNQISGKK